MLVAFSDLGVSIVDRSMPDGSGRHIMPCWQADIVLREIQDGQCILGYTTMLRFGRMQYVYFTDAAQLLLHSRQPSKLIQLAALLAQLVKGGRAVLE